jgi:hypothetical protein
MLWFKIRLASLSVLNVSLIENAVDKADILHRHRTTVVHNAYVFKDNIFPEEAIELLRHVFVDGLSKYGQ